MMTNPFTKTAFKKSMVQVNAIVSGGFLAPISHNQHLTVELQLTLHIALIVFCDTDH